MGVPPSTGRPVERTNHLIKFYFVVRPVTSASRFRHAAATLRPGGWLAAFWNAFDPPLVCR
jgi:hypothetical protein